MASHPNMFPELVGFETGWIVGNGGFSLRSKKTPQCTLVSREITSVNSSGYSNFLPLQTFVKQKFWYKFCPLLDSCSIQYRKKHG